jgi:hypothetical protein
MGLIMKLEWNHPCLAVFLKNRPWHPEIVKTELGSQIKLAQTGHFWFWGTERGRIGQAASRWPRIYENLRCRGRCPKALVGGGRHNRSYIYINSYEDMLMSKIQIHFEGGPFLFSFFQEENWLNTLLRHALLQICACWLYFATSGHSYTLTTDGHSAAFIFLMIDTWTFYPDWLQEIPVWFARPFGCLAPSSDFWRISTLPASCFFVLCFSSCLQRNFGKILTFCMFFYGALQLSLLAVASWYRSHALAVHALEPFFA